jgi:hypothetical protein
MNPLKKITLTQKYKNGFLLFFIFFCLGFNSLHAQMQNNGNLHIADNSSLYLHSGDFAFGSGSSTTTSRSAVTHGKFQKGATTTTSGAATGANLFINGYASTYSSSYFVLPTGHTTTYAPIGITNAAVTSGVTAAYTHGTPANSNNLDASVATLYSVGSWNAYGDNAKLTFLLTFRFGVF